jgi:hypothetical protein
MTTEPIVEQGPAVVPAGGVTDEQLIAMLVGRARGDGLKLTGEGGLLQQLTKRVLESALEGEITDHVGYDEQGTEPIIPKRKTDGVKGLGKLRYVVEQTFALLHQSRRLAVRWERRLDIHDGLVSLACALICWRRLVNWTDK